MSDFLTFKSFISIDALIIFYYLGAVIIPISSWFFAWWLVNKYRLASTVYTQGKDLIWSKLPPKRKTQIILICVIFFLFMELFWRMLFEFLIAYIQIRNALVLPQT